MVERRERLAVPVEGKKVTAILSLPAVGLEQAEALVVLAHGAGNDMEHPLLVALAEGLAARGYAAVRFNFPYREAGRKTPDPVPRLEATWLEVTDNLHARLEGVKLPLVVGGKSLGGKIAAQLVADGVLGATGLLFLGYPLHRAGDETELRDGPIRSIRAPMLFVIGSKDRMCRVEVLEHVLRSARANASLHVIEDADHSLDPPKLDLERREAVQIEVLDATSAWLRRVLKKNGRKK